jgi:maltooligosyltrehalose trehalohydrolase
VLGPDDDDLADLCRWLADLRAERPELTAHPLPPRAGAPAVAMRRGACVVAANLTAEERRVSLHGVPRAVLLATADGVGLSHDAADLPPESAAVIACCRLDPR